MNIHELKEKWPRRFQAEYEKWYEHAADYDWWEDIYDTYTEQMTAYGVRVDTISFDGFYCQGGYANWGGYITNSKLFMEKTGLNLRHLAFYSLACEVPDSYTISIDNSSNYYKYTPNIEVHDLASGYYDGIEMTHGLWSGMPLEEVEQMVDEAKLEEDVAEWVKDQWSDLDKTLQDSYEEVTNEEAFIESCECNEVEFDETNYQGVDCG